VRGFRGALLPALVAVGLAVLVWAVARPSGPEASTAAPVPASAPSPDELRQFQEESARTADQRAPRPVLPEDQRAGWIAAWNKMRDCAVGHGYEFVPAVAPSYGDGATPAPMLRVGPQTEAMLQACPFDTSLFDLDKVRAATAAGK
jgi:hypothetical protein